MLSSKILQRVCIKCMPLVFALIFLLLYSVTQFFNKYYVSFPTLFTLLSEKLSISLILRFKNMYGPNFTDLFHYEIRKLLGSAKTNSLFGWNGLL